jgi:hypothetical protein
VLLSRTAVCIYECCYEELTVCIYKCCYECVADYEWLALDVVAHCYCGDCDEGARDVHENNSSSQDTRQDTDHIPCMQLDQRDAELPESLARFGRDADKVAMEEERELDRINPHGSVAGHDCGRRVVVVGL